jgi:putative sigma-54 modulation protein
MEKYFNGPAEANVVLSIEKFRHSAEINIMGDRPDDQRQRRNR